MRPLQTLPRLRLALDGEALGEAALSEVRVSQALSLPGQCELVFRDPPGGLAAITSITKLTGPSPSAAALVAAAFTAGATAGSGGAVASSTEG